MRARVRPLLFALASGVLGVTLAQESGDGAHGPVPYQPEVDDGRSVFGERTLPALIAKHLGGELDDPRVLNPKIPESFARVILKALAEEREARWQSAAELRMALDGVEVAIP